MPLMKTRHQAEGDGGEGARRFAEAQFEVAGDGVRLGDVIERDHDDPEDDHGGNGADPIPVHRQNAVLIGRRGPAHEFERTQVGGEETEAGHPSRHLASREEEIFAGLSEPLEVEADSEDGHEIQDDDGEVDRGKGHQPGLEQQSRENCCNRLHLHIVWDLNFRVKDGY